MPTTELTTFSILFIFILTYKTCNSINIIPDYFMESGALGDCGETIANKDDIYLRSHVGAYQLGSVINYGANENCVLTFDAGAGKLVLVKFLHFELENPDSVTSECVDGLKIYNQNNVSSTNSSLSCFIQVPDNSSVECNSSLSDNSTLLCNSSAADNSSIDCNSTLSDNSTLCNSSLACNSSSQSCLVNVSVPCNTSASDTSPTPDLTVCSSTAPSPFVSTGPEVRFNFYTNGLSHFSGFQLLLTAFREDANCSSGEFKCDTNRCIPDGLKCDTVQHCVDGTDENSDIAGCTILDTIIGYVFGLGQVTIITISILGGVVIFTIVTTIITYHVCCKKSRNTVQPIQEAGHAQAQSEVKENKSKKGKKAVTVVEPAKPADTPPLPNKKAWDKKSKKKEDENDDFW